MKVIINNKEYETTPGKTILDVCTANGIKIPTLCFLKKINEVGSCRICMVEVKGARTLIPACITKVSEGMEILTDSERVINSRKQTLKLILENHNYDCEHCVREGKCELQKLVKEYDIEVENGVKVSKLEENNAIIRDNSKCILCNRCVAVCTNVQGLGIIGRNDRGIDTTIGCEFERPLSETKCVKCGQCINVCPTGALQTKNDIPYVKQLLEDKTNHVIVAPAPAVRAALCEEFDLMGNTLGKLTTALRNFGFTKIFDINLTADLTVMEEATELLKRLESNSNMPMFTSCCPAWVSFIKYNFPEFVPNLSTCKSPQQMFGAVMKTYYAKLNNLDPSKIKVVTIMPCTAKKNERTFDNNIDAVLTTREIAKWIKEEKIDFASLEDSEMDSLFGEGHSVIFGSSGGVMETALRTAKETLVGHSEEIDFYEVRGVKGIKEAEYEIGNKTLKVAVVSGLLNARKLLKDIKSGKKTYDFVEVMSCQGGCINGGGQPIVEASIRNTSDYRINRMNVLYDIDSNDSKRRAHENEAIKKMYNEYFEKPGSTIAEEILHNS